MQPKIDLEMLARCDEARIWADTSAKYDNLSDMLADGVDIDYIPESYYSYDLNDDRKDPTDDIHYFAPNTDETDILIEF
jgi:hypothetical protein